MAAEDDYKVSEQAVYELELLQTRHYALERKVVWSWWLLGLTSVSQLALAIAVVIHI